MGKYLAYLAGAVLLFAPRARADNITVTNGTVAEFAEAVSNTITAGGGTIQVKTPIMVGSTNGEADVESFDGESKVIVSGGNANPIFIVLSGSLSASNMTLQNGLGQFGGAVYIATNANAAFENCTFTANRAFGVDGDSADSNTNSSGNAVIGKNGARGTAGESAFGGAIYNNGDLFLNNCKFITNSVIGGTGGDGADGQDAGTRGGNGGSGGAGGSAFGGGVFNYLGRLTATNCTFSDNIVQGGSGGAGGIGGTGIITGVNGFGGASGIAGGGGLYTADPITALVMNSTFDHNLVQGGVGAAGGTSTGGLGQNGPRGGDALGGGIENNGALFVMNSTFFENEALGGTGGDGGIGGARGGNGGVGGSAIGGGIYNSSYVLVVNATFSKGSAVGGTNGAPGSGLVSGGIGKHGSSFGGNIANVAKKKHGSFQLFNSIVAAALSGGAGYGTISNGGFNISADKTLKFKKNSTSLMNTDPLVGDLGVNGGLTQTCPLKTNSPAIDKIPPDFAPDIDQRGFGRPFGTNSDIGAYELNPNQVVIITPPQSTNVAVGSNALFTVVAQGTGPLVYQWFFNNSQLLGATSNSLLITNVQSANFGNYFVVVSNSFNAATSSVAVLGQFNPSNSVPFIANQPTNRQDVVVGTSVTISVTSTSAPPQFFQWYFTDTTTTLDTFLLIGATNSVLSIPNAQTTNTGFYVVVITNITGAVTSSISKLVVTNAPSAFLRIKGAPAPAIQMVSGPRESGRNAGTSMSVDLENSVDESLRRRVRYFLRTEPDLSLRPNIWPHVAPLNAARTAQARRPYQA